MILRVFRATIQPGHQTEFERKFREISLPLVEKQPGLVSCVIGRPATSSPNEFVMISTWRDEEALRAFTGEDYTRAVIPKEMEEHMVESSVHHYELMECEVRSA
jgi:heme oxygenase (mycobilin-producing)